MRRTITLVALAWIALPAAGASPFTPVADPAAVRQLPPAAVRARAVRPFRFDAGLFSRATREVAAENPGQVRRPSAVLELPHPDGSLIPFRVIESPVMPAKLAAKLADVRTFRGEGIDDPTATVRFDVTPRGFSAMVLSALGSWYVSPWSPGSSGVVAAYYRRDVIRDPQDPFQCTLPDEGTSKEQRAYRSIDRERVDGYPASLLVGPTLRTYRLALATTGEYAQKACAPEPAGMACTMAALVTAMNRVNGIYERELGIRLVLVADNDAIVYTNPDTDPYSGSNQAALALQNQANLDTVIGDSNYDIGHLFSTSGGGVAGLGVVCRTGLKARAKTGLSNPFGDPFYVDYVSHEMGHQFGAHHTFNGSEGPCAGTARYAPTAYEPGSGSTIMAYAGICGSQNLQSNSDPYFHGASFDEIVTFVSLGQGATCVSDSATANSAPLVDAGPAFTIPAGTPFELAGSAFDADGDSMTYCWEELDLGAADVGSTLIDDGSRPVFRSYPPVIVPTRSFPRLPDVISGSTTYGETLPGTSRTMTFRLTARDNRGGGGGVNYGTTTVTSVANAQPFSVTSPSTAVTWMGHTDQTVSWSVAGTADPPISCATVAISFSSDGGVTFPTLLLASTPNDGTQTIIVPNIPTTAARIKVACVGNVFFAVSRPDFTVAAAAAPSIASVAPGSGPTDGGTPIVISGSGFAPGAVVTIGGQPATSVAVLSSTSVTAVTAPGAAGAFDVVVTNPGGASGKSEFAYTYVPVPQDAFRRGFSLAYFDFYYQDPACDTTLTQNYGDSTVFNASFVAGPSRAVDIGVTGQAALGSYLDLSGDAANRDSVTIRCLIDAGTAEEAACPGSGQLIVLHPTPANDPGGGLRFLGVTFPYAFRAFYANPAWSVNSTHTVTISFRRARGYPLGANVCGSQLFVRY